MNSRKPRIVMLVSAALIAAIVIVFAVETLSARDDRRDAAARSFQEQAIVSASVIESVFGSGVATQAQRYSEELGSAEVDRGNLEALKKESQLSYAVVLDASGDVIATTEGLDPALLAAIREGPQHVDSVFEGAPFHISGIVRGTNAEYVSAYESETGKRVLVQGFPVQLVAALLGGTLAQLPQADRQQAYIVDDKGQVVAAADEKVTLAGPAPQMSAGREDTSAAVGNTQWQVVLSAEEAELFANVDSNVEWLVLAALAVAGAFALFLLFRALRQSEQLAGAYAELERSNEDLARTNTELQRSNSELEQFASVASHDLQEPLRKVQTFGDQLERRHGEQLDEEAKDYLRRMRNASSRMSSLIDDLLRFSRVTTHAKPHAPVDLARVARDVVSDLDARVIETGGEVHIGSLPVVQADPTQMRQLLQNLIGNALKFHRPGVAPVVRLDPAQAPRPGAVAFTVTDNGIGFEAEYEDRIFRVFERLHPRDVYAGTGIGLALCRKIVERHGGSITGTGRPDEGATFTVALPAGRPARRPHADSVSPEPEPVHA